MRQLTFAFIILISAAVVTGCARTRHQQQPSCQVVDEHYVHKYGIPVPKEDWSSRGKHGQVITTLDNGVVVKKNYVAGDLHGETTYTFPHSDIVEKRENYANGKLMSEVVFDMSGHPREEVIFENNNSRIVTLWFEGGEPMSRERFEGELIMEGEYYTAGNVVESRIDNGSGTRFTKDAYGQTLSTDVLEGGKVVSSITYHANGNPKAICPYRNGIVEGERKVFLPAGEPEAIEGWAAGVRQGVTVEFKNGEKYAEVPYANGKKNGLERRFRDGAVVTEEISWLNDFRHGPSVTFLDGKAIKTEWYVHGRVVPKASYERKITGLRR